MATAAQNTPEANESMMIRASLLMGILVSG
jgi:hypothetical protein